MTSSVNDRSAFANDVYWSRHPPLYFCGGGIQLLGIDDWGLGAEIIVKGLASRSGADVERDRGAGLLRVLED